MASLPTRWASALVALLITASGPLCADLSAEAPRTAAESRQRWGGWCGWMQRCATSENDRRRYGLHMDNGWRQISARGTVVVLVHGFNSTPGRTRELIREARAEGLPCGAFAYPNDQPLRASAELLSEELKRFAVRWPFHRVALVTHSMGGLIARECLEDSALRPGNVERLIMVAPPTHGSTLARFAVGWDVWEHWINRRDGGPWRRARESIADGMGQAPQDLRPGSGFLTRLNGRGRSHGVPYTILLGTDAQLSDEQRYVIRRSLGWVAKCAPGLSDDPDAIEQVLDNIDEVLDGRGDGAVAVDRGRLEGVADTHVLPFSHLSVVRDEENEAAQRVRRMILKRLLPTDGA